MTVCSYSTVFSEGDIMLRGLNQIEFSDFGKILNRNFEGKRITITEAEANTFYQCEKKVCIETVGGMCALCILHCGYVQAFFLDKPVELYADTAFCLTAVGGSCFVKLAAPDLRPAIPFDPRFSPLRQNRISAVDDIIAISCADKDFLPLRTTEAHCFFELTYLNSGTLSIKIDGKDFTVQQNEFSLLFPGQQSTISSDKPVSFLKIIFAMTLASACALTNRVFRADPFIRGLFSNILAEYESPDKYSPDMLLCCLQSILFHTMRSSSENAASVSNMPIREVLNPLVRSAIGYINTHNKSRLSLPEVADALKLSPSYLSRLFKKHTNCNITEYIRLQKLEKAKKLLRSGGYTVTEVSEALGFSSIHYFSSCFKKQYGKPPLHYTQAFDNRDLHYCRTPAKREQLSDIY